jgi:hypothetical protein
MAFCMQLVVVDRVDEVVVHPLHHLGQQPGILPRQRGA